MMATSRLRSDSRRAYWGVGSAAGTNVPQPQQWLCAAVSVPQFGQIIPGPPRSTSLLFLHFASNQAIASSPDRSLYAIRHSQLADDVLYVGLNGAFRDK